MGLQIRLLNAGNSTKSFAAFAALERGRQHENASEVSQSHCTFIRKALSCLVSFQNDLGPPQGPADPCPYRKSNPDVLMVQTSEVWGGHDTANGLHSTRRWCILVQR